MVVIVTAVILALLGLALAGGGLWLVMLGGSPFYLVAGAMLCLTAFLL